MIITRTPLRISFFGGGTDYPDWFRENGGAVLATSIDKYIYLSCRHYPRFFDYNYRVVYGETELCQNISEIKHPCVRACVNHFEITQGLEIVYHADLPARSGLGSSSSFTVGLIHALNGLTGRMSPRQKLAEQAIMMERDVLCENVGSQDQIMATFGGLQLVTFSADGFRMEPVTVSRTRRSELESHLMLYYTGISRIASEVAKEQISNIPDRRAELTAMRSLVDAAVDIVCSERPIAEFGHLLDETWRLKRRLSARISNSAIDDLYSRAREAGALGGKLLGAGGGGFFLLFVPPELQPQVRAKLSGLLEVPFRFESSGSETILYQP